MTKKGKLCKYQKQKLNTQHISVNIFYIIQLQIKMDISFSKIKQINGSNFLYH